METEAELHSAARRLAPFQSADDLLLTEPQPRARVQIEKCNQALQCFTNQVFLADYVTKPNFTQSEMTFQSNPKHSANMGLKQEKLLSNNA